MGKACIKYDKWKSQNEPNYKPWINPELYRTPRLDWNDINEIDLLAINNKIQDSNEINESEIKENELENHEDND